MTAPEVDLKTDDQIERMTAAAMRNYPLYLTYPIVRIIALPGHIRLIRQDGVHFTAAYDVIADAVNNNGNLDPAACFMEGGGLDRFGKRP